MTYTTTASTEPFLCSRLHVSAVGFNGFTYTWRETRTAGSGSVDSRNFCNDKKAPAFSFASIFSFIACMLVWFPDPKSRSCTIARQEPKCVY